MMRYGWGGLGIVAIVAGACFDIPEPLELPEGRGGDGAGGGGSTGAGGDGGSTGAGGSGGALDCALVENGACLTVTQIQAGGSHTCALMSDDSLRCWGSNAHGQLGVPSEDLGYSVQPRTIPGLQGPLQLALGYEHSCALKDGGVWCWGRDELGEVGVGVQPSKEVPVPQQVELSDVTHLDSRCYSSCAVRAESEVWCWGFALNGQGWQGEGGTPQTLPAMVDGLDGLETIEAVSSGGQFACALGDGKTRVLCWGYNGVGALGNGTFVGSASAVEIVTSPAVEPIAVLAAGSDYACTLSLDRRQIHCWGWWSWMGAHPEPQLLVSYADQTVEVLDAGWRHACMILDDHSVRCWGDNTDLQVGVPDETTAKLAPVAPHGLPAAKLLTVGRHHNCIVAVDESVWCWGRNDGGQLGIPVGASASLPTEVTW